MPDGYFQRYADKYLIYGYDLWISEDSYMDDLDSYYGLFYPYTAYGAGIFSLYSISHLYGKLGYKKGDNNRQYSWCSLYGAGFAESVYRAFI